MSVPHRDSQPREPGNATINAPAVALFLAGAVLAVQVVRTVSPDAWQDVMNYTVVISGSLGIGTGDRPLGDIGPLFLHPFAQQNWMGALVTAAALLAMGGAAARPFGDDLVAALHFLGFFFACAVVGALVEISVGGARGVIMMGDWTAVSGCIAGAGWALGGRMGCLRFAGGWAAIQLLFLFLSMTGFVEGSIGSLASLAFGAAVYPIALRFSQRVER
jgi:membrane associated rhomboid family serine protease